MRKDLMAIIVAVGLVTVSSPLVHRTAALAAQAPHSTAVYDADGRLKLPTGYRRWVFVGAPLTPNGLNHGEAHFLEYHHVYVEAKNVDSLFLTAGRSRSSRDRGGHSTRDGRGLGLGRLRGDHGLGHRMGCVTTGDGQRCRLARPSGKRDGGNPRSGGYKCQSRSRFSRRPMAARR